MQEPQSESNRDAAPPESGGSMVSSEDARRFNAALGRLPNALVPDVDTLNGLLTALLCAPRQIAFDRILLLVTINWTGDEVLRYENAEEVRWLTEFVQRHLIDLHYVLSDSNRLYEPCIMCETRPGNHWARGFTVILGTMYDEWKELTSSDDYRISFSIISALAFEHRDDPNMRTASTEEIDPQRSEMLGMLPDIVKSIYGYFADQRKASGQNYPKYFSGVKMSLIDPTNDADPEVRRVKKKFGLEDHDFSPNSDASAGAKRAKKKKVGGKTKRRRW